MPIDPNIALGVKPMQVKSQGEYLNELYNQQNAEQSNQLNMMKMQAMNREIADSEAVKNYFATTNRDDPNFAQGLSAISPKLGMDYDEYTAKIATQRAAAAEHAEGTTGKKLANTEASVKMAKNAQSEILEYPSEAMLTSWFEDAKRKGYYNPETLANIAKFNSIVLSIPAPIDPATGEPDFTARRQAITRLQLEAKDRLGKPGQRNLNDRLEDTMVDPITGIATVTGTSAKGVSPDTVYTANKPVYNENAGGFVTPPTAANPKGGFTPLTEVQTTKDVNANRKALKTAGYDPVTGVDNISKLIDKSTGSWTGTLTDASLGGVLGVSTEGSKAIQQLKTFASTLTTDLLGGKLGAGISNTDRDFILEGLGNVADSTRPRGDRLAAWEGVKARMISAGMFNDKQNIIPKNEKMPSNASAAKKAKFEAFQKSQNKARAR